MKVNVVGGGPGSIELMVNAGISAIKSSDVVLTSLRLNDEFSDLNPNIKILGIMDTIKFLKEHCDDPDLNVSVLASGDVGFYSIASILMIVLILNLFRGFRVFSILLQSL